MVFSKNCLALSLFLCTEQTKNIFLESACFEAIGLRRTSQRHNLRTDAAMRFEKGVDPNNAVYALKRAALLIKELAGGEIASDIIDIYPQKVKCPEVTVRFERVSMLAGIPIFKYTIEDILRKLEMQVVSKTEEAITVKVPTNKVDVLREIDVIEEILRIYGFNNIPIPEKINATLSYAKGADQGLHLENKVANYLAANGFYEIMNNSLTNSKYYKEVLEDTGIVNILNSQTTELDVLRTNLLFPGLESIAHNQKRKNNRLKFYEFGTVYKQGKEPDTYVENEILSLFLTGNQSEENWQNPAVAFSFYDLKKEVFAVLESLGLQDLKGKDSSDPSLAYGLSIQRNGKDLVQLGMVKKDILKKMDVDGDVYAAFFQWKTLEKQLRKQKISFSDLPKYPSVRRDVALLVDSKVKFADIEIIARKTGRELLTDLNLFDVYEDEQKLGKGKKSYAVSFTFLDKSKTLTKKEIDKVMEKLIQQFGKELGAIQK